MRSPSLRAASLGTALAVLGISDAMAQERCKMNWEVPAANTTYTQQHVLLVRLWITAAGRDRVAAVAGRVAAGMRDRMPAPPAGHEETIRRYLVAVLDAVRDDGR